MPWLSQEEGWGQRPAWLGGRDIKQPSKAALELRGQERDHNPRATAQ